MPDLGLALEGLPGAALAGLRRSAGQIVLFGSRAAGLARPASDWDLLVVSEERPRSAPALDLVWVSPRELSTRAWLGSELAGHVACWGRWLHGEPDWVAGVVHDECAAAHKARRVASKLDALERTWDLLGPAYQRKHLLLLRRDLQRHALLSLGEAVPPSALLDAAWKACADPQDEVRRLARGARALSPFFERIASHLAGRGALVGERCAP